MPERISWENLNKSGTTFLSPAYKSNGHVFTSGQTGKDPVTGEFPSCPKKQTELAIKNAEIVLNAAGTTLDKTLKVLLFISDAADSAAINEVYAKYFINKPARSCIIVKFPNKNIKVEMELVAEYKELTPKL